MLTILPPVLYGVFARWPEDGKAWIHPDDVRLVRRLIPSNRVFRRDRVDGEYNVMRYGETSFRVRPALWRLVKPEGFEVGEWIEVRSLLGKNEPGLGRIREMLWHEKSGEIRYFIDRYKSRRESQSQTAIHVSQISKEQGKHYTSIDLQAADHIPLEAPLQRDSS